MEYLLRYLLLALAVLTTGTTTLSGCGGKTACTMEYRYGVTATVRNATTGSPITDATAELVDGSYRETMEHFGESGTYSGAGEREGTYTLTVTAPGFQSSAPRTIEVKGGECHVTGQQVTIDLTPL
jgi:hypothetical protein